MTTPSAGLINFADFSFESPADLLSLQPNDFVLLTLSFNTLANGVSPLQFGEIILGDVNGAQLNFLQPLPGSINVQAARPVDEPLVLWLFGVGLMAFGVAHRRKRTIT